MFRRVWGALDLGYFNVQAPHDDLGLGYCNEHKHMILLTLDIVTYRTS